MNTEAAPGAAHSAFEQYVVPEIPVLLRVANSLTGQPADAEDLVQDVLIRAYRAIEDFDGRHVRAWLLTILRRTDINRRRRRQPVLFDDPDTEMDRVRASGGVPPTPEGIVVGAVFDAAVEEALGMLPDRFRQGLELVDVAGLTYAEAAEVLGLPAGTVMSRVHRARARVRSHLIAAGLVRRQRAGARA